MRYLQPSDERTYTDSKRMSYAFKKFVALAAITAGLLQAGLAQAEQTVADQVIDQLERSGALDKAVERVLERMRQQQIAAQQAQAEKAAAAKQELARKARPVDSKSDMIFGKPDATVSIIEYSDFECPYCKQFSDVPFKVIQEIPEKVNLVWRHFPLPFHDPAATRAAIGAVCAAEQGGNDAFWKFTDAVFKLTRGNGQGMPATDATDPVVALARTQGLDGDRFVACMATDSARKRVAADLQDGIAAGITGTPGVILINHKTGAIEIMPGAVPADVLKGAVNNLLGQ